MTNQPSPLFHPLDLLDWQSLNTTRTELGKEHLQKAAHLSQSIRRREQRWQVYLCALGLQGFQEWLTQRAPELNIQSEQSSIWQPAYANLLNAACNIQIDSFKLCLVTPGSYIDTEINLPNAIFDLPNLAAHFYVLMQVIEEQQNVAVIGFLTHQQYHQHQKSLSANSDWTYTIPLNWFNPDPNALLLHLRCLDNKAIPLPTTTPQKNPALQNKLQNLKTQLQTQPPWNILTPAEGATLLNNPNLVNLIYQTEPTINVRHWFQNQLDTVATQLGWLLLPTPALPLMRSLQEEFDNIRNSLQQQGIQIPPEAKGAYQNLHSNNKSLRLYAVTWLLTENNSEPEWTLLIALSIDPKQPTPKTLKLEIREQTQQLFTQTLTQNLNNTLLYAQVIGNSEDQFWVTITADEETVFQTPPFNFQIPY